MTVKIDDFYHCTRSHPMGAMFFTEGKSYQVVDFDEDGDAILITDQNTKSPAGVPLGGVIWDFVHEPQE